MTDDTTPTGHGQDGDRLTVAEAASRLGVTPDAIRARIRRGTLEATKGEDGSYVVILPPEEQQDTDATPTGPDTTATAALVAQLQGENAYLRTQLETMIHQAAKERERADVLQREALQRLEALTAGPEANQDPPGSPESVDTRDQGSGHGQDTNTTATGIFRRLLRWMQGG